MSSSCLQFIGKERRRHPGKGGLINGSGEQKKDKKTKKGRRQPGLYAQTRGQKLCKET